MPHVGSLIHRDQYQMYVSNKIHLLHAYNTMITHILARWLWYPVPLYLCPPVPLPPLYPRKLDHNHISGSLELVWPMMTVACV